MDQKYKCNETLIGKLFISNKSESDVLNASAEFRHTYVHVHTCQLLGFFLLVISALGSLCRAVHGVFFLFFVFVYIVFVFDLV